MFCEKRIGVLGCKHTTKDMILGLEAKGINVDVCITINPEKGKSQEVAGYYDLRKFLADKDILCITATKYNLNSQEDIDCILALRIDLLLVIGWQRLVPEWFLQSLEIGAFGMHGSSKPLPHGRGRSPINWSLIQGKKEFFTHLFQYLPGVDDGPIVGVQKFEIHEFDTCLTLHHKNTVAMVKLCEEHLENLAHGVAKLLPQPKGGASYYPKRTAEDGIIYWEDSTADIYNLIRGVTKPFPGAFTYLDRGEKKLVIWKAIPFDSIIKWKDTVPGEILEVFFDGTFVVKTRDTTILVQEYDGGILNRNDIGKKLSHHHLGISRKVWDSLPA